MANLQLAKTEDGTILILHEVWPKYVARLNSYVPFDVDFIIVESVVDKRDLDKELPRIKEFITNKRKFGEIWVNIKFKIIKRIYFFAKEADFLKSVNKLENIISRYLEERKSKAMRDYFLSED